VGLADLKESPIKLDNKLSSQQRFQNDKKQLEFKILHECPQLVPDFYYSTRLQIVIARLLEKNPQARPSSDELMRLIPSEYCVDMDV